MAVLGRRFWARAFSSCGKRGPLFIAVHGPLTIAASLVAEHRLQTRRLSNCGSWAKLLRGMWGLPRPGLKPASPALAGRFSTTAPPGKPYWYFFNWSIFHLHCFRCIAKWFRHIHVYIYIHIHTHTYNTHIHTYIYSFSGSFPLQVVTRCWIQFPVLHSRTLLFMCFIHSSLYLLIPNSQVIPPPISPL